MTAQVEKEGEFRQSEVVEGPESFPEQIEKIAPGVQVVPTQFQKQVTDDQGKPLIQTPENKKITIELPKPEAVLEEESKGLPDEAKTWWAKFWLRLIGKARLFGWQVVGLLKAEKN